MSTTQSDADDEAETTDSLVENRSEILFLMDAQDCNPNGNPLSPNNKPRKDPATGEGIITDVRLKRYIRDQIAVECDDDECVYIADIRSKSGNRKTRSELAERVADVDKASDIGEGFLDEFLDAAVDVRYFGSTFSFSTGDNQPIADAIDAHLPSHIQGPVQISPGRSYHRVRANQGYNSLTSVISTNSNDDGDNADNDDRGNVTGGYQLDDHRIVYGVYGFSAVVNEHAADNTNLTQEDVEWLDKLFWRGVKNQANSRSKRGQHPRLYMRVEYEEGFHIGNLDRTLNLGEQSEEVEKLTDISDITVAIDDLVDELRHEEDRIKQIHILQDTRLSMELSGEVIDQTLPEYLEGELEVAVNTFSPHR